MTSKSAEEASRLTSALTGISLAVGIAREATDAVPIVKQCLGAAVRIVALAEKMDKDREALRSLSDKSLQLAQRVKDVMKGRAPDAKLETSLGRILKALESIEMFMALADAVQELLVVALLDVDHQVHATHAAFEDNARFAGEFRLLRHCEVHKLDCVFARGNDEDANAVFRYHRARVDGQVLVVRYSERIGTQDPDAIHGSEATQYDLLFKELSTVQKSHPNVARIYGWGKGSIHNRFTVIKSGYHTAERILDELPDPSTSVIQWDAADHLRRQGILWDPSYPAYVLDEHLEPTIGLQKDLYRIKPYTDPLLAVENQIVWAATPSSPPWLEVAETDVRAAVADCQHEKLTSLLDKCGTILRWRYAFSKSSLLHELAHSDSTAELLLRVLAEGVVDDTCKALMCADMLLALDKSRSHRLQNGLRVFYIAEKDRTDWLRLHGLAEDSERIVYDEYILEIPDAHRDEARAMFGIPAPSEEEYYTNHLIAAGGPGTYSAPE